MIIKIQNAGKKIKETNYWDSEYAQAGYYFFSINAGCIRMLVPDSQIHQLAEFKTGKKVIISRGPWPQTGRKEGFEILFEDYSDAPHAIHVGVESWQILPEKSCAGKKWDFAIWTRSGCMYQKKCYYRIVPEIPYLKAWGE